MASGMGAAELSSQRKTGTYPFTSQGGATADEAGTISVSSLGLKPSGHLEFNGG